MRMGFLQNTASGKSTVVFRVSGCSLDRELWHRRGDLAAREWTRCEALNGSSVMESSDYGVGDVLGEDGQLLHPCLHIRPLRKMLHD
uniref:Uncharacterized protein n=1 Tax=Physcomitrium patens TaxID=3218 RepID=A0A2K1KUH9_PHYPA|nr:hypothetical protein PHYPA_004438 [Physcomitrium patens]